jgi:hypothetical protein
MRIRMEKFGSGINIAGPQHWFLAYSTGYRIVLYWCYSCSSLEVHALVSCHRSSGGSPPRSKVAPTDNRTGNFPWYLAAGRRAIQSTMFSPLIFYYCSVSRTYGLRVYNYFSSGKQCWWCGIFFSFFLPAPI